MTETQILEKPTLSTDKSILRIGKKSYARHVYSPCGEKAREICIECDVALGQLHEFGCSEELCPRHGIIIDFDENDEDDPELHFALITAKKPATFYLDGQEYWRLPYSFCRHVDSPTEDCRHCGKVTPCFRCDARVGELHILGCSREVCPIHQLKIGSFACDCTSCPEIDVVQERLSRLPGLLDISKE